MNSVDDLILRTKYSDSLTKAAGSSFEETFSNIAFSYLQEKATKLADYLVGFEVVEKDEDNTKAVGIFAFKVGDQYVYVPVHFLNGQIKPLTLMYLKSEDLFVPLDEDWINYLLRQAPVELGSPSQDHKSIQFSRPDLQHFTTPPRTGRYISASLDESIIPDWLSKFELPIKKAFARSLKNDTEFQVAISKFANLERVLESLREDTQQEKEAAANVKVQEQGVKVVCPEDAQHVELMRSISDEDQQRVREGKTVVYDSRADEDTSDLYTEQYLRKFQNPNKSGIYKVVDANGSLINALVLINPKSMSRMYASDSATVVELDTGNWTVAHPSDIWVRENVAVDDWSPLLNKLSERDSGAINGVYVLVSPDLLSSVPFKIMSKTKDSTGLLSYQVVSMESQFPRIRSRTKDDKDRFEEFVLSTEADNIEDIKYPWGLNKNKAGVMSSETMSSDLTTSLTMSPNPEGGLCHLGRGLVVPGNYGLLKLNTLENPADRLYLGDTGNVKWHLCNSGIGKLTVRSDGSEYYVSVNDIPGLALRKRAAVEKLACEYGIKGADALDIVDSCEPLETQTFFIKFAQNYPPGAPYQNAYDYKGPTEGPPIPDPTTTSYGGLAQMAQRADEQLIPLTTQQYPAPPDPYNPLNSEYTGPAPGYPAEMDTGLAMQAAGTGQQKVFDHAVIGSLAKTTQTSDLITSYIPELQTAVDRLGRILFLMWSDPSKFKDLYGVAEMAEAEDKLKDVFQSFGEILLTLKSKESTRLVEL